MVPSQWFRRSRHTIASALLLGCGVAAATAAFSISRALTPLGLPYPHPERLVTLSAGSRAWSPAMFEALLSSSTVFDAAAGIQERAAALGRGDGPAEVIRLESVSAAYFDLLGAAAAVGRPFTAAEDRRGDPRAVVVISHALWQRRFGGAAVSGRTIEIDGRTVEIVGVLARGFGGLIGRTDAWVPLASARWLIGDTGPERPWSRWFEVIARTKPGVPAARAQAQFAVETGAAVLALPGSDRGLGPAPRMIVTPLVEARTPAAFARAARILTWAFVAMLALVVVNVTALHAAAVDRRAREIGVRMALGAGFRDLSRLAAREAAIIAAGAGVVAVILHPLVMLTLAASQPEATGFGIVTSRLLADTLRVPDAATVLVAAAASAAGVVPLGAALLVGARRLTVERALGGDRYGAGLPRRHLGGFALVILQSAAACAILAGGALLTRSGLDLINAGRGYQTRAVYTARLALPAGRYDDATAAGFYAALVDRLGGEPGISSASVANCAPGEGRCRQSTVMSIDGRAIEPPGQPAVGVHFATANHFATIGATVQRGRTFADDDRAGAPLVAVITAPLAARLWPGSDAIGRRLQIYSASGSLDGDRMVIGVLEPIAFDLERDRGLDVFLPAAQQAWTSASVFAAGTIDSRRFARSLAAAVASIDRSVAIADAGGLDAPLQRSLGIESFLRQSLLFFGTAGLLLAAAGALATTAQAAARRRREAAVRLALGATPLQVLWLTARRGIAVAAIGAAAGLAGAAGTAGSLRALLHGLSPHDPIALMAGPAITFVALAAAVAWPSMTASRSDPATLLRADE